MTDIPYADIRWAAGPRPKKKMNEIANRVASLPRLIEQAAAALAKATTAAEVLDAKDRADVAYTAAKATARFAKAKDAHDTVIAACPAGDGRRCDNRARRLSADLLMNTIRRKSAARYRNPAGITRRAVFSNRTMLQPSRKSA